MYGQTTGNGAELTPPRSRLPGGHGQPGRGLPVGQAGPDLQTWGGRLVPMSPVARVRAEPTPRRLECRQAVCTNHYRNSPRET